MRAVFALPPLISTQGASAGSVNYNQAVCLIYYTLCYMLYIMYYVLCIIYYVLKQSVRQWPRQSHESDLPRHKPWTHTTTINEQRERGGKRETETERLREILTLWVHWVVAGPCCSQANLSQRSIHHRQRQQCL